jgi:tetratricopeptide (TPR) repeat protein
MKNMLSLLIIFCSILAIGQTSEEYLQKGIEKHNKQDYKGAIKEYSKSLKENESNRDAYFNRGICELAISDYSSAMADISKTIELDPEFVKAYYSRATVFASQEKYVEALPDLDKTIELDADFPNALALRGQIRAQTGDKKGACEDFNLAKKNGDKNAQTYLTKFCGNEQQKGESFMLDWPESENWKLGSSQENEKMAMMELIHSDETLEKWTEFGYMMSIKGVQNLPMDKAMNLMFDQAKAKAPKAVLTFIEKDETAEFPWILFTIESPSFKNDKTPESQLWYIVQGKTSLYTNFRAVKQATVPDDLKEKWIKFFKAGKVVYL